MKSIDEMLKTVFKRIEYDKPKLLTALAYPSGSSWTAQINISNKTQGVCLTCIFHTKIEAIEALEQIARKYPNSNQQIPIIIDDTWDG